MGFVCLLLIVNVLFYALFYCLLVYQYCFSDVVRIFSISQLLALKIVIIRITVLAF